MVGYLASTDNYFRITNGEGFRGTESHYGVGGKWGSDLKVPGGLDGAVWQWQDRAFTADANLDGGPVVISVETADNAARPIQPWTPRQLDALVDIGTWECSPAAHTACPPTWACHRSGIPAGLIPDTRPGRRGIGYHRQGCPPNIVSGGVSWSRSTGKDCPTQVRIDQLTSIVIPRIRARLTPQVATKDSKPEAIIGDDMADVFIAGGPVGIWAVFPGTRERLQIPSPTEVVMLQRAGTAIRDLGKVSWDFLNMFTEVPVESSEPGLPDSGYYNRHDLRDQLTAIEGKLDALLAVPEPDDEEVAP